MAAGIHGDLYARNLAAIQHEMQHPMTLRANCGHELCEYPAR